MPSRFLDDMGYKIAVFGQAEKPAAPPVEERDIYNMFDIGDRVKSPQFGKGEVVDIDGLAVSVDFDDGSNRKLNIEYARLDKI